MSMTRRAVLAVPAALVATHSARAATARPGLIFAALATCPYCAQLSPILRSAAEDRTVDLLVASMDGGPVPPFPHIEDGRRHPLTAGLTRVPVVFVYNPHLDTVTHAIEGMRDPLHFLRRLRAALDASALL